MRKKPGSHAKSPAESRIGAKKAEKEEKFFFLGIGIDKSTVYVALAAVLIYFAFVAYLTLTSKPPEISSSTSELPISKNSGLMLAPGETYVYYALLEGINDTIDVTYNVRQGSGCTLVLSSDNSTLCLKNDGLAANLNTSSNLGYGNMQILVFKPWMLAVAEGWGWGANSSFSMGDFGEFMAMRTSMKCTGLEKRLGRDAYRVEITVNQTSIFENETGTITIVDWIDADKRVLLEEQSAYGSVVLASAPFEITNSG